MKNILKVGVMAATMLASANVVSGNLYLDLGNNSYDETRIIGMADANTTTGAFSEFGLSSFLGASAYDVDASGNMTGGFIDSNVSSELRTFGVPANGTSVDGSNNIGLTMPDCGAGECGINALSPLTPPMTGDAEGFFQNWDLQVEYHLEADIIGGVPQYTSGYIEFFFNDYADDSNDRLVLTAELTGSDVDVSEANLDLFFDVTFAESGFLFVDDGSGNFQDAGLLADAGNFVEFQLDTALNPIPTGADLLLVTGDDGVTRAISQSSLGGSVSTTVVPEPSALILLSLSLIGFGVASRRRK